MMALFLIGPCSLPLGERKGQEAPRASHGELAARSRCGHAPAGNVDRPNRSSDALRQPEPSGTRPIRHAVTPRLNNLGDSSRHLHAPAAVATSRSR